MDNLEFTGLLKEAIEDKLQEYVVCLWLIRVHVTYMWHVTPWNTSHRRCHTALKLLNMLVPNFESRADVTDNLEFFCAPVCVLFYISSSNHHSDLNLSCSQVPTMHVVTTQAGSKSQLQNGSTTTMVQENSLLPMGRRNVALVTTLQAALSAQSIMIGIVLSKSHMSSPIPFALIPCLAFMPSFRMLLQATTLHQVSSFTVSIKVRMVIPRIR